MTDRKFAVKHEGVGNRRLGEKVTFPQGVDTDRLIGLGAIEELYGPDAEGDAVYDDSLSSQLVTRAAAGDNAHDGAEIERRKREAQEQLDQILQQKAQAEADRAAAEAATAQAQRDKAEAEAAAASAKAAKTNGTGTTAS